MTMQKVDISNDKSEEKDSKLLVFGFDAEELNIIESNALENNIVEVINISKDQTGLTLKELLEGEKRSAKVSGVMTKKIIIFYGFSQKKLHEYIEQYKSLGVGKSIFATVTPTNLKWKFGALVKELLLEQMMMAKQQGRPKHK